MTSSDKDMFYLTSSVEKDDDLGLDLPEKDICAAELISDVARGVISAFVKRCKEEGVSKAELAKKLGVDRSLVTKMLRGNANLTLRTLGELCWALDITPRFNWIDNLEDQKLPADVVREYAQQLVSAYQMPINENLVVIGPLSANPASTPRGWSNLEVRGAHGPKVAVASPAAVFRKKVNREEKVYAH